MKPFQITLAIAFSGLAIFVEFRDIKETTIFPTPMDVPFPILCILALAFLIINVRQYIKYKKLFSFLPVCICVAGIMIIYWHIKKREHIAASESVFTAGTYQIGSDGGFRLHFKKDGNLTAERLDHWLHTEYWGHYHLNNDTLTMEIPLNFQLGRRGILTDTSLRLLDDTIRFHVIRY